MGEKKGEVVMYRRRGSLRTRRLRLGPGASARASAVHLGWTVRAQRPWALWLMPFSGRE